jgi:hypothetical protein
MARRRYGDGPTLPPLPSLQTPPPPPPLPPAPTLTACQLAILRLVGIPAAALPLPAKAPRRRRLSEGTL